MILKSKKNVEVAFAKVTLGDALVLDKEIQTNKKVWPHEHPSGLVVFRFQMSGRGLEIRPYTPEGVKNEEWRDTPFWRIAVANMPTEEVAIVRGNDLIPGCAPGTGVGVSVGGVNLLKKAKHPRFPKGKPVVFFAGSYWVMTPGQTQFHYKRWQPGFFVDQRTPWGSHRLVA